MSANGETTWLMVRGTNGTAMFLLDIKGIPTIFGTIYKGERDYGVVQLTSRSLEP